MEPKIVKTLFLLEAIGKEDCQSQRELAKKLNMSLGLVNSLIKKLTNQGLLKIVSVPKSKIRYSLTAKGISERENLSILYTSYLIDIYKETKNRLQHGFDKLFKNGIQEIILYGANELSEIVCSLPQNPFQKVIAIIDNKKDGQSVNGIRICNEHELKGLSYDAVIITDTARTIKVKEKLIHMNVPDHKIFNLFKLEQFNDLI